MQTKLIIVGGFLGAGKTSLLWDTAKKIKGSGGSVGLITNDQASGLVDTAFLETGSGLVKEVHSLGGDVKGLVPDKVLEIMMQKRR